MPTTHERQEAHGKKERQSMQFDLTDPKFLIKLFLGVAILFFGLGSFHATPDANVTGIGIIVAGALIAWAIMEHKPN